MIDHDWPKLPKPEKGNGWGTVFTCIFLFCFLLIGSCQIYLIIAYFMGK